MQKKIIALAVAALASSAAFAQSNVTIYGVADAYLASSKTDDAKRQNLVQSGGLAASRLGFKGAEDLGNGLKAIFALEYRLEIDNNSGVGFTTSSASSGPARQQLVGLTGGFGTAVAGRLQTTAYDWAVKYDALAGTAFSPLQNVNGSNFIIGGTTAGARASNAVAYISPSISGLTVALNHAKLSEQTVTNVENETTATMVGAYYDQGPLSAGLVYSHVAIDAGARFSTAVNGYVNPAGTAMAGTVAKATGVKAQDDWALGASYDFGVVKAFGTYQRSKYKADGTLATVDETANRAYSLGLSAPVSAKGAVIASYASNSIKNTAGDDDTKSYTLAYTHSLSKRTTGYVGFNGIIRDGLVKVTGTNDGADTNTFVAGLNHKF